MPINKKIPTSHILNEVKIEILYVLMIGLSVLFVTPKPKAVVPKMPISIPAFFGTAISVILSIKLNESYDRWWEAIKIGGSIVNDSRSFVIQ